ncbi:hypothetical protein H0H92_006203 [Tricholoma furcatifolium]|nr:hypothetical protein H0H92_006203 [Tricholoma furcatifolium]
MAVKEGYKILQGGVPLIEDIDIQRSDEVNAAWVRKMLLNVLLNKERLLELIPSMLELMQTRLETWGKEGQIDPFKDVYDLVFQVTVYMATCRELASDLDAVKRLHMDYWRLEKSATPVALLLPWFPSQAKKEKEKAMTRLYLTLCSYVDARRAAKTPSSDAIDLLLREGVGTEDLVASKVASEVQSLLDKHIGDSTEPIQKRLASIPVSAWEDEMPMTDAVLRETMRLTTNGTALRRNLSQDVNFMGATVPRGGFVVYPVWDTHLNPEIYERPREFDPGRFGPGREEDKKTTFGFLAWGAGRHPCPGMKVAKLEVKMVMAFFLSAYDFSVVDAAGNIPTSVPHPNYNDIHHTRPLGDQYLIKFKRIVE